MTRSSFQPHDGTVAPRKRSGGGDFVRRIRNSILACVFLPLWLVAQANSPRVKLVDRAEYQAALRASSQEMHEVAALKFERLLNEKELTRNEAALVSERLVDALLRAREPQKALVALTLFDVPEERFWRGQIFLEQQKYREAELEFKACLDARSPRAAYARLALGQAIVGQGRENTGRKEFKTLLLHPDPVIAERARILSNESEVISDRSMIVLKRLGTKRGSPESEFVKACAYLDLGDGKQAEVVLRRFIDGQDPLPARLHDAAMVRLAEAYAMQPGRSRTAEKVLLQFLDRGTDSDYLEQAFALLRRVAEPDDDDLLKNLLAWSAEPQPPGRHALALYHLGQWFLEHGRVDEALKTLEDFRAQHAGHPREGEALRSLMTLYGSQRNDERVLALAKVWRARFGSGGEDTLDFLTGMIRHARSEYADAATLFEKSAFLATDPVQAQRALYNAAISALTGGDATRYRLCLAQLQAPAAQLVGDGGAPPAPKDAEGHASQLILERALHLAAKRDSGAEEALQEFLKLHPTHPRAVEAHLAQAELCMLDLPARTKAAGAALDAAAALTGLTDEWRERLDYTRLWWHEGAGNLEGVATAGTDFLNRWTASQRRDEVRMKIAQAFFRREDYAKAQGQFEALAEEHGDSPYAEVALFFAGRAAMARLTNEGIEKAITLWEEVVSRNGPLTREAQLQQALAKRRQGKEDDALVVIENLLATPSVPSGERLGLLGEKGELLMLLARKDPKHLGEAAAVFAGITRESGVPLIWRAHAGVLLAQCLRQSGKMSEALEACFDVVESGLSGSRSPQEHTWIYRAGFLALELLEAKADWPAAAHLSDRLAKAGGERAEEARLHASRLRLEHFLWEK